jgi:hypothetical protein
MTCFEGYRGQAKTVPRKIPMGADFFTRKLKLGSPFGKKFPDNRMPQCDEIRCL